jgi:predicted dehydrogenase
MTDPLRIGVVGVGDFGVRHLRAYVRQQGAEVVAVADRDPDRAQAVAARWGVPQWFANGDELIAACRPDGVSVVTPGPHHLGPTLAALAHGCSVLLEKPVAMSSADVAEIENAAAASTAFVLPAHILRFAAPYVELRARVKDGAVGRVLGISSRRDRDRDHVRRYGDVHPALLTLIHDIDLAVWISGSRAVRVNAHERLVADGGPPQLVWAQVEAADGSVWSLRATLLLPVEAQLADRLEVYGTDGVAALGLEPAVVVAASRVEAVDHVLTPDAHPGALDAEVAYFCACVRNGAAPDVVTLAEAAHGVRIAEAIMESAAAGGTPVDVTR